MEYHRVLPPSGAIKVNVHGTTTSIPYPNGNTTVIGMIARNSERDLLKLSTSYIPSGSSIKNKLNVILHGLKRSFEDKYKEVIIETDNLDAFSILKNFPHGVPAELAFVAHQIIIRINDPRWICSIIFIYSERNGLTIHLAKLGADRCTHFYTLSRPIGAVEELLSQDMGFGHIDSKYQDIEITEEEEDSVDFEGGFVKGLYAFGGYAFKEDYFAMEDHQGGGLMVMKMHEEVLEDFILGKGYTNKYNF